MLFLLVYNISVLMIVNELGKYDELILVDLAEFLMIFYLTSIFPFLFRNCIFQYDFLEKYFYMVINDYLCRPEVGRRIQCSVTLTNLESEPVPIVE